MQLQLKSDNLIEAMSKNPACNIKNDSKSFYAYVRSKQNVQDKVGSLEDSAGNIISRVFNGGRPKWLLQFSVYQRRY